MKKLKFLVLLMIMPFILSGCYTVVDMGQPLEEELITEIEKDYEETDYGESYYSGSHYGGYSDYYVLPWWYSITPVTVVSGGSSDDTPTHTTVVRKRDKESLNLRNRDGGRNSSGDGTGSSATRSSGNNSSGTTATTPTPTKSTSSNDSGGRSSGSSDDGKKNSGRSGSGGGRK
jgi:hypothetical protein